MDRFFWTFWFDFSRTFWCENFSYFLRRKFFGLWVENFLNLLVMVALFRDFSKFSRIFWFEKFSNFFDRKFFSKIILISLVEKFCKMKRNRNWYFRTSKFEKFWIKKVRRIYEPESSKNFGTRKFEKNRETFDSESFKTFTSGNIKKIST